MLEQPHDLPEIASVGVAIRDPTGAPVVALSISGLGTRITSRLAALLALREKARIVQALVVRERAATGTTRSPTGRPAAAAR